MKNKIKVVLIFALSAIALTSGICVAYYNTCDLAFDSAPVIASVDDENISFLDFKLSRKKIEKVKKEVKKAIPKRTINM